MSKATEELRHEHRAIERVLASLEVAAERIVKGERVNPELLARSLAFAREFVDQCHHAKEENALFPALVDVGASSRGGPVDEMLGEHQQGRSLVAEASTALADYGAQAPGAGASLSGALRGYVGLLRQHIAKEDGILFPLADRTLDDMKKAAIAEAFDRLEQEVTGPGEHERHLALIGDLEAALG
jgi:hemerythrin-like domain-containing protein